MQRFRNILVYTEGDSRSRAVLKRATALATRNKAHLTVLSVLESLPRELQRLGAAVDLAELWEVAVKERNQKLDRLIARVSKENVSFSAKVLGGSPFIEVIKEVLRQGHDLVMMAAEGEGGVNDVLFGSTSTHLMRKCPCPVWVMKAGRPRRYARVLAAVDPAPSDPGHNSLNLKIMELATSLSRMETSQLHVVHAWAPVARWLKLAGSRLTAYELAEIDRANEKEHSNRLDELLAKLPLDDMKVERHLLEGDASDLVPRLALEKGIDVIVMGTVCRAGVPGLFIGNTAERVLRQVSCSVLTVKPEGFVSPVTMG
jgi:universal stress protein E